MKKYSWEKGQLEKAVKESYNYSDTLRKLNIPTSGNNGTTLRKKLKEYNISISHFTFRRSSYVKKKDITNYLVINSNVKGCDLKKRLFSEGYKEYKCEECGITTWRNNSITLQIHHINGINTDNRLENLKILCPNCHSQTNTYCGNANKEKIIKKYYCPDCGREISKRSRHCLSCAMINRHKTLGKIFLSKEELKIYLDEGLSNTSISRKCNVTEAAIRKWIKKYNL